MRAGQILVAAVLIGLLGGYAWSHLHIRSLDKGPSEAGGALADPTVVERSVYYANCDEVRAAGMAPLYLGEPGYRPEMDGDSDGIACEPYRGM